MEVPVKEFNHEVRIWMPRNWVVTRRRVSRTGRLSDKTEVIPTVIEGTEAATGEVYPSGDCKLRPQELNRYRQQRNYVFSVRFFTADPLRCTGSGWILRKLHPSHAYSRGLSGIFSVLRSLICTAGKSMLTIAQYQTNE